MHSLNWYSSSLLVLKFTVLISLAQAIQIVHVEVDDAHLVETGATNYAISAPELTNKNWRTVSVNGDNIVIVANGCQVINKSAQSLDQEEKTLLGSAYQRLISARQNNGQYSKFSRTTYSKGGSSSSYTSGYSSRQSSFQLNGVSISKLGENEFSVSKSNLPNNMARVFVSGDLISFVFLDGKVLMKPTGCLQADEIQLIDKIKKEVQETEQQYNQSMQTFSNNLNNNMHQMQMNMQNLQQQMSNMFASGYHFNNPFGLNQAFSVSPQSQQFSAFHRNQNLLFPSIPDYSMGGNSYSISPFVMYPTRLPVPSPAFYQSALFPPMPTPYIQAPLAGGSQVHVDQA